MDLCWWKKEELVCYEVHSIWIECQKLIQECSDFSRHRMICIVFKLSITKLQIRTNVIWCSPNLFSDYIQCGGRWRKLAEWWNQFNAIEKIETLKKEQKSNFWKRINSIFILALFLVFDFVVQQLILEEIRLHCFLKIFQISLKIFLIYFRLI